MTSEQVGRAIHRAKEIGGPWGPACGVPYGFDSGEFECECPQMGTHLLELVELDKSRMTGVLQD